MVSSDVNAHAPVLLSECIAGLQIRADGFYVDATYGRGGHARSILQALGSEGSLLVLDRDPQAVAHARATLGADPRVVVRHATFDRLPEFVAAASVAGVLFDLGVSSPQLDDGGRGFSFLRDGPLDMRMDPTTGASAADFVAHATEREIVEVLFGFGEERHARRIARALVAERAKAPIVTTAALADIVARAVPGREPGKHPSTRTFQALRMQVNQELELIERGLAGAVDVLAVGGRVAVISFHSLEDRLVKRFLRRAAEEDPVWRGMPEVPDAALPRMRVVGRALRAAAGELAANPRARSATLRIAERVRA